MFIFIEIIVIFAFFTEGKLQPTERKHYLDESELYEFIMNNIKSKFRDADISIHTVRIPSLR